MKNKLPVFFFALILAACGSETKPSFVQVKTLETRIRENDPWFKNLSGIPIFRFNTYNPVKGDTLAILRTFLKDYTVTRAYMTEAGYTPLFVDSALHDGYVNDTFFDANFDGTKDYIINYYSPTGCCPREENRVFLFDPKKKSFDGPVSIMNAYYDSTEKFVYTMGYGFPGEGVNTTGLEKSKWSGDSIVAVEGIYIRNGKLMRYDLATDIDKPLDELPLPYQNIPQIDWYWPRKREVHKSSR